MSIGPKSTFSLFFLMFAVIIGTTSESMATPARQLVTTTINERQTVELTGNTRPEATAQNDQGRADDSLQLNHMLLLLNRPAEREADLENFIDQIHDPASPHFHQWLAAGQIRSNYGPAETDITVVSDWLSKHGLTVNAMQASGMVIDFSGTAGQIRDAFKTEIHNLNVKGVTHIANMSNPRVPAALSGVVNGVVSLHDFKPHPHFRHRPAYTYSSGNFTYQAMVPADLATIYNLGPLFSKGITGVGQTIVVIEDTDVYSTADWTTFRSTFGLSGYTSGSFSQIHPNNCTDPGIVSGNEIEAELDAEWASAAAPGAAIVLASCQDTATTFGGLIALQNLVNGSSPPSIVSISYGECEAYNGTTANAAFYNTYQQAVAEGVSVFVSAGDYGAAMCDADDADLSKATHGIGVNGYASTPYNVAVGGTDFGDTYAGTTSSYWNSTNTATYGSAMSYIPEIPWNDSCASPLIASYLGYSTTYGTSGFCNSQIGKEYFLTTAGGSGGPSGCATGSASEGGVVSGTCAGWPKPSWQALVGNPADTVRDIPDVSLFAANGVWGHYYVVCDSDIADGGAPCTGAPGGWSGAGGTSFSSPIWAGFQALVNQNTRTSWGNPSTVYYPLAAMEYGSGENCNSSSGTISSNCIFYDITQGDMDVNCTGSINCYRPSGKYGVLSTSSSSYSEAYGTTTGWDFATGIGTVNVYNLVNNWGFNDCLFNWAEGNYPALFVPAGATTAVSGVYTYRHYSATNAYLGVSSVDNHVYYMVGSNGTLQDEGPTSHWLPKAGCQ